MNNEQKTNVFWVVFIGVLIIVLWFFMLCASGFDETAMSFVFLPIIGVIMCIGAGCYAANIKEPQNELLTGDARLYYEAYQLASDMTFGNCYNRQAAVALTSLAGTPDLNAHSQALLRLKKERYNNDSDSFKEEKTPFHNHKTPEISIPNTYDLINWINKNKEEDLKDLSNALSHRVRPELIQLGIIESFEYMLKYIKQYKSILQTSEELIYTLIGDITNDFNLDFTQAFECIYDRNKIYEKHSAEMHLDKPTTGLDFSVITSSVFESFLYAAMDNHEHERQRHQQTVNYQQELSILQKGNASLFNSRVMEAYNCYQKNITNALKRSYEFLSKLIESSAN